MKILKRILELLIDFLPHLTIGFAFVLFVCFVVDRFNRAMAFINHDLTKWMLAVFCVLVVIESVLFAIHRRKRK